MEGPIVALDANRTITSTGQSNVIGYCLGGTLLAGLLAYLQATGVAD